MKRELGVLIVILAVRVGSAQEATARGATPPAAPTVQYAQLRHDGTSSLPGGQGLQYRDPSVPLPPAATDAAAAKADDVKLDGRCQVVRPGDIVHYELSIRAVESAKFIDADIELHNGDWPHKDANGLLFPDFRTLGGSSPATRDPSIGGVYHFQFTVPQHVLGGTYRGTAVLVTVVDDDDALYGRNSSVPVNRHTRRQVKNYCLVVVGAAGDDRERVVTNFKRGPIERK
jgi:hypothetical protein